MNSAEKLDIRSALNFNEPEESEKRLRDLYAQHKDTASEDLKAEILTQIARSQGLQRRFDDARKTLEGAKQLLEGTTTSGNVAYFLELGRVENSSGNPLAAKPHFLIALSLAKSAAEDFLAVDAAHMLGIVHKGQDSLDWNEEAISMAEASSEPKARNWLGSLYNNTGWTYYEMGDHTRAMELFRQALDFRLKEGKQFNILIARYCIGKCLRAMGQFDEALLLQLELLKEHEMAGNKPGFCYEEIAECLLAIGRASDAKAYFAKAFEVLSKDAWLMNSEPERVLRLGSLGEK